MYLENMHGELVKNAFSHSSTGNAQAAIQKRIDQLEREEAAILEEMGKFDLLAGQLESVRTQNTRAIIKLNALLVADAVQFPTFIGID